MLAYQKWFSNETPENTHTKGDHLVGKYYVAFDVEHKKQTELLIAQGMSKDDAIKNAPIMQEAYELLRRWEAADPDVLELWEKLNNWVLDGFNETLTRLNVHFDLVDLESQIYQLGKQIILSALQKKLVHQDESGAIFIDLTNEGLDKKILLRNDGTSMYITQDIGVSIHRYQKYSPNE